MDDDDNLSPIFVAAHIWQSRGWQVIPAQPGTKRLVRGFGFHLDKVETGEAVDFWFRERKCNLAVIVPESGVILDFDRIEVYNRFCAAWPDMGESYTESTPRGGRHVFLESTRPVVPGLGLVPGIEVKRICLVYPSTVGGVAYAVAKPGGILRGDVLRSLESFLAVGGEDIPPARNSSPWGFPVVKQAVKSGESGILAELKERWPIVSYLRFFEPKLVLSGRGRWLAGRCPWHDDRTPSLWVDSDRNLWGCHGCGAHGDIVNWHALRLQTSDIGQAARDLAKYQIRVMA